MHTKSSPTPSIELTDPPINDENEAHKRLPMFPRLVLQLCDFAEESGPHDTTDSQDDEDTYEALRRRILGIPLSPPLLPILPEESGIGSPGLRPVFNFAHSSGSGTLTVGSTLSNCSVSAASDCGHSHIKDGDLGEGFCYGCHMAVSEMRSGELSRHRAHAGDLLRKGRPHKSSMKTLARSQSAPEMPGSPRRVYFADDVSVYSTYSSDEYVRSVAEEDDDRGEDGAEPPAMQKANTAPAQFEFPKLYFPGQTMDQAVFPDLKQFW